MSVTRRDRLPDPDRPQPAALSKSEILDRLRGMLVDEFELKEEQVVPAAHLFDDLDLDSIDAINMAVRLEQETGLELTEEELRSLRTLADIVDVVHRKLETRTDPP